MSIDSTQRRTSGVGSRTLARLSLCTGALLSALGAACGGEDATHVASPGDEVEAPALPLTPDEPEPAPLYVGATRVFSADSSIGYLFAVPSLGADAEVDLSRAVELNDAWVFGKDGPDFYTATIFEPTIKAWHVNPDGSFVEGPTVSFVNEGVTGTYTAASVPLFSEDKSYFVDPGSLQVVVWNPRDMTFIETIPLPAPELAGFSPLAELTVRGDRVLVSIFMQSEDNTRTGDFVRLIAIDPATDEIVEQSDDVRCGSFSPAGASGDGTIYYSPWDYHTVLRSVFGEGYGSASCGLRVIPPAGSLDTAYEVDLSSLVGGRPAASMQLLGGDQALLHVWHQELVNATPETWADTRFEPGYKWYRWTIGSTEAAELPDQAPSVEGSAWRVVDGKVISFANNAEYSETTLIELDDTDHGRPGLRVPGWIVTMLRAY
jgi:hypothetical protein